MRPRIEPLAEAEWTEEQRPVLGPILEKGRAYNTFGTLARHWEAYKRHMVWAHHVLGGTFTLTPREREVLILRTAWLCRAEYVWGQHVVAARAAGLTEAEIARIKEGPAAEGWEPLDSTLLRAVDELHAEARISDGTWAALSSGYATEQLIDLVLAVGQYTLVSMANNSWGVQLDEGVEGF